MQFEVFFEAKIFDGLPVEFTCDNPSVTAEVGRESGNTYRLRNTSDLPSFFSGLLAHGVPPEAIDRSGERVLEFLRAVEDFSDRFRM